ncbi:hypothetical protein B0H63DRAFT_544159 [Podospora didyma]|uniref:Uncharacterized protein n=1 Tax=Podospora didyma TaxID=330526 RepID=A0AAE0NQC0_9PEZI|nr:hypothetical protein B0H63DRAFT_544159 [Podospora didyma]
MLSKTAQVFCWGAGTASALAYHGLVTGLGCDEAYFQLLLAAMVGWYAIPLLQPGHRLPSSPLLDRDHVAHWALLVSLGAITNRLQIKGADLSHVQGYIHALMALTVHRFLLSIKYNRRSIEPLVHPFSHPLINGYEVAVRGRHQPHSPSFWEMACQIAFYSTLQFVTRAYEPKSRLRGVAHRILFGNDVISVLLYQFLPSPFNDLAETIFYFFHERPFLHWIPREVSYVGPEEKWSWTKHRSYEAMFIYCLALQFLIRMTGLRARIAAE